MLVLHQNISHVRRLYLLVFHIVMQHDESHEERLFQYNNRMLGLVSLTQIIIYVVFLSTAWTPYPLVTYCFCGLPLPAEDFILLMALAHELQRYYLGWPNHLLWPRCRKKSLKVWFLRHFKFPVCQFQLAIHKGQQHKEANHYWQTATLNYYMIEKDPTYHLWMTSKKYNIRDIKNQWDGPVVQPLGVVFETPG
jgi:hypothetical protein